MSRISFYNFLHLKSNWSQKKFNTSYFSSFSSDIDFYLHLSSEIELDDNKLPNINYFWSVCNNYGMNRFYRKNENIFSKKCNPLKLYIHLLYGISDYIVIEASRCCEKNQFVVYKLNTIYSIALEFPLECERVNWIKQWVISVEIWRPNSICWRQNFIGSFCPWYCLVFIQLPQ